jgi:hypothetical protein
MNLLLVYLNLSEFKVKTKDRTRKLLAKSQEAEQATAAQEEEDSSKHGRNGS